MRTHLRVLAALMTLTLAPNAWARCEQQLDCAGPICWTALLIDESFSGEDCPDVGWVDERTFVTNECSTIMDPRVDDYALLDTAGGYTETDHFYQEFDVPVDVSGTPGDFVHLELSFDLTNVGPVSWWDIVEVKLTDVATNQLLHNIQVHTQDTSYVCSRFDYDISGNHAGKRLRLTFNGKIFQPNVEFHILWADVFLIHF